MTVDEKYMYRCIELARLGRGEVAPNPMVGAVVVYQGRIIGEGFHREYGGPHAEVNAINSVKNRDLLPQSTLYVNLEPCSHFGKTPPCCDLIIRSKIPRVAVGITDCYSQVCGAGIERLRAAGTEVKTDILHDECMELNRMFFTFHLKKRPYVVLKWAQTADGFIDRERLPQEWGTPTTVSNPLSHIVVHRDRTTSGATLTGTNTALHDNPRLSVRLWCGRQPLRAVLDRTGRLPRSLNLFDGSIPTLIFTNLDTHTAPLPNVEFIKLDFHANILQQMLTAFHERNIQSIVVEGGQQLLQSFIDAGCWDEAHIYTGATWFGRGICAPRLSARPCAVEMLDDTQLAVFRNGE
ncbi:MAG: bifunctional diaminohydroxyphosphoribosylaminopyrimidine deaminase/5-amino-6-(5-phosphoribosylamino)uracil reductase RibD [Bacteroidales bacterium]|jgi:diaminohydroxyphosphoribosylaminopyrimidine deaminase/5-amino-6-(5-phosphoribosylamino)uracil reductase|nr:bifunctional diaminohydroxyphosphoribosylaminopyrimidine deaminase/5-amino-6-(5-phosphoribosylamino)uracil reductase RibD [Bacteroidales bacterium]